MIVAYNEFSTSRTHTSHTRTRTSISLAGWITEAESIMIYNDFNLGYKDYQNPDFRSTFLDPNVTLSFFRNMSYPVSHSLPVQLISGTAHFRCSSFPVELISGMAHFRYGSLPVLLTSGTAHFRYSSLPVQLTSKAGATMFQQLTQASEPRRIHLHPPLLCTKMLRICCGWSFVGSCSLTRTDLCAPDFRTSRCARRTSSAPRRCRRRAAPRRRRPSSTPSTSGRSRNAFLARRRPPSLTTPCRRCARIPHSHTRTLRITPEEQLLCSGVGFLALSHTKLTHTHQAENLHVQLTRFTHMEARTHARVYTHIHANTHEHAHTPHSHTRTLAQVLEASVGEATSLTVMARDADGNAATVTLETNIEDGFSFGALQGRRGAGWCDGREGGREPAGGARFGWAGQVRDGAKKQD